MTTGKGPVPAGRVMHPCSIWALPGNENSRCSPETDGAASASRTPGPNAFAATAVGPSFGDDRACSTARDDDEDAAAAEGCIQWSAPSSVAATAAVNESLCHMLPYMDFSWDFSLAARP